MAAKHQVPDAGNEAAATSAQKDGPKAIATFHYLDVYSKDLLVQSLVQVIHSLAERNTLKAWRAKMLAKEFKSNV